MALFLTLSPFAAFGMQIMLKTFRSSRAAAAAVFTRWHPRSGIAASASAAA